METATKLFDVFKSHLYRLFGRKEKPAASSDDGKISEVKVDNNTETAFSAEETIVEVTSRGPKNPSTGKGTKPGQFN